MHEDQEIIEGADVWLTEMPTQDEILLRIQTYERAIAQYRQKVNALRMMLQARRMLEGQEADLSWLFTQTLFKAARPADRDPTQAEQRPGTSAAVLQVLASDPMRAWGAKEIFEALQTRGWLPDSQEPRKALGATLSRLTERTKQIDRVGRGLYRLSAESARTLTNEALSLPVDPAGEEGG